MTVAYVALYTCPVLARPASDPAVAGFHRLSDEMAEALRRTPPAGLLAYDVEPPDGILKPRHVPAGAAIHPTLSVWKDLPSAFQYSYRAEAHRRALRRRREWFAWPRAPIYVLWYVDEPEEATWAAGAERLNRLAEGGPSPWAFDFLHPYSPDGSELPVEAARGASDHSHDPRSGPVRVSLDDAPRDP